MREIQRCGELFPCDHRAEREHGGLLLSAERDPFSPRLSSLIAIRTEAEPLKRAVAKAESPSSAREEREAFFLARSKPSTFGAEHTYESAAAG